ncbi:S-adenosyl-L-methionine-dependent methyltransferase [Punctularia strigosozonata HHB-11173 SS5]|uniref:S-adenosyl-L-methionine-dependent methyltransferase n=1 Tax=Punctularia strigosozonata (strain HHB-11173) TaxID=741275 RepID=UPI0004417A79|nr:S-adenosyl-L-methionine-dependent methyltransferase [Punctularia strigosozonata HHB-11173 SS5]EIN07426.1 S-adenosyl-L-methionine-dependent methyltransferase [Punctularia strigosozonata HHB-11173 SS5]
MSPKALVQVVPDSNPESYEAQHVHHVYDQIASHFSSTRYKPWPLIARFISELPTGWVGLDAGTGNGKYLPLPLDRLGSVWTIGLDRSRNLLEVARKAGSSSADVTREVILGDVLDQCWRRGAFDYAISIATIHHLSTRARRKEAIKRLLEAVSPEHGRVLIYVWAVEQDELSKRVVPSSSEERYVENQNFDGQDVFVPWIMTKAPNKQISGQTFFEGAPASPPTFNRYYHMFARGELRALAEEVVSDMGLMLGEPFVVSASSNGANMGARFTQDGWERSNYYLEIRRWHAINHR